MLKSGSTVLDIGSGLSYISMLMAHMMNASSTSSTSSSSSSNTRVICVDHNERVLALARNIASLHFTYLLPYLTWQKADVFKDTSLSFMREAPFSAIHVGGAIHGMYCAYVYDARMRMYA